MQRGINDAPISTDIRNAKCKAYYLIGLGEMKPAAKPEVIIPRFLKWMKSKFQRHISMFIGVVNVSELDVDEYQATGTACTLRHAIISGKAITIFSLRSRPISVGFDILSIYLS